MYKDKGVPWGFRFQLKKSIEEEFRPSDLSSVTNLSIWEAVCWHKQNVWQIPVKKRVTFLLHLKNTLTPNGLLSLTHTTQRPARLISTNIKSATSSVALQKNNNAVSKYVTVTPKGEVRLWCLRLWMHRSVAWRCSQSLRNWGVFYVILCARWSTR